MEKREFFQRYNLKENDFEKTGLKWNELISIKNNHLDSASNLEVAAHYVAERLKKIESVHSIRKRIKDPECLMAKIIRRKIQNPSLKIGRNNYAEVITDLVGVRALHLFKEDWEEIHEFIVETWELEEKPVANVCEGDHSEFIDKFHRRGCEIHKHPFGYRSVHYLINFDLSKKERIPVEIQVRTILEEAWSEMDHQIRYPYNADKTSLSPYLLLLNRLLGSADEMGSFIKLLEKGTASKHQPYDYGATAVGSFIGNLGDTVKALHPEGRARELLEERVTFLEVYLSSIKRILNNRHGENSVDVCLPDVSHKLPERGEQSFI